MLKYKVILTAACLAVFMFVSFVNSGNADFEIEEMYPSYGGYYDYSGWLYHTARVQTSESYSYIWWYINGEYVGSTSSHVDNPKTTAYFSPSGCPGSPHGKQYEIKAVAQSFMDENGNIDQDTDSYNVYVYSTPVRGEITSGNYTMATLYGEVDVGWNGTTAEAKVYGKITNNTPYNIVYGIRVHYAVGRLTGGDPVIHDRPDRFLIDFGTIKAHAADNDEDYSYSDSYKLRGGIKGETYYVEAAVTVTAQVEGGDPNKMDKLFVPEYQELTIPKD